MILAWFPGDTEGGCVWGEGGGGTNWLCFCPRGLWGTVQLTARFAAIGGPRRVGVCRWSSMPKLSCRI